ncbi:MAG: pilus assembly PilX N-terminal domain-containing protein, partial [Acidobacteriota bacterium]|nr:pilus assembly PilX N-terminal domain-containing protein [Acidobacteriota bacterium]
MLVILASMGIALLFLSQSEVKMSRSDIRSKQAYFLAETGLEDGRTLLFHTNGREPFDDDLDTAAGTDDTFNALPSSLRPTYDTDGNVNGFTGYGDDVPLLAFTPLTSIAGSNAGAGGFAAFVQNDSVDDAIDPLLDTNQRVLLTGVGAGEDGSFEVVQAIVEYTELFPAFPPATITILGPNPVFAGGTSNAKEYIGDDCGGSGGIADYHVPVVGTIGTEITSGMPKPDSYYTDEGAYTGLDTVADVSDPASIADVGSTVDPIDSSYLNCLELKDMVEATRDYADVVCTPPAPCVWPPSAPDRVVMIDGDWVLDATINDEGLILITGSVIMHGAADWRGLIMVIGEGQFLRNGAGNGNVVGGVMVADIAGPDNVYGTSDDCTGG